MGRTATLLALLGVITLQGATRSLPTGDARRGRELFRSRQCITCHSVNGEGGTLAPDLARAVGRGFSPYQLAALLWNHIPQMSSALKSKGIPFPELSDQDGADLFVYFYSARFFEASGDAGRGSDLFRSKRCASCHGISQPLEGGAPPVASWQALDNPVVLAQRMWNHSSVMRRAMDKQGISYPRLSSTELTDILVYLRQQTKRTGPWGDFAPGSADAGRALVASKRCTSCHRGPRAFEDQPTRYTLTDLSVSMWNHPPVASTDARAFTAEEMRDIIGYVMAAQFLQEKGDFAQGAKVFEKRQCARCHDNPASGAPPREQMAGRMSSFGIIAAVSRHGPAMLERMQRAGYSWPHLTDFEMADLATYLHGLEFKRRTPVPGRSSGSVW